MALRWTEEQYEMFLKRTGKRPKTEITKEDSQSEEKKSKYKNEKIVVDEITFDSKKEARFYTELKLLKKAGEVKDFILQPEFILQKGYTRKHDGKRIRPIKYKADFKVIWADGRVEIIDVKPSDNFKTQVYRLKRKMFEYHYPNLKLIEIYE